MQRSFMNRRAFSCGLGSVIAGLPVSSSAETWPRRRTWAPWKKRPSIVVISTASNVQFADVDEAVNFWNATLADIGTPFRLGSTTHIPGVIPHDRIFRNVYDWGRFDLSKPGYNYWTMVPNRIPAHIRRLNADVLVVLTEASGPSFVMAQKSPGKVLVVIQSWRYPPGKLIQNVIAHEFGHVIGLGHNTNPTTLMCGGVRDNYECTFEGAVETFQPLTNGEKAEILAMYPPGWAEEPPASPRWKGDPPVTPNLRFGGRVHAASSVRS